MLICSVCIFMINLIVCNIFSEFFDRQILCQSMVWTCAITGRSSLTFEEALESERSANDMLNSFPLSLQLPVLYLMNGINENKLGAIIDVFYAFMNAHYFIGEEVYVRINSKK